MELRKKTRWGSSRTLSGQTPYKETYQGNKKLEMNKYSFMFFDNSIEVHNTVSEKSHNIIETVLKMYWVEKLN